MTDDGNFLPFFNMQVELGKRLDTGIGIYKINIIKNNASLYIAYISRLVMNPLISLRRMVGSLSQ